MIIQSCMAQAIAVVMSDLPVNEAETELTKIAAQAVNRIEILLGDKPKPTILLQ